MYQARGDREAQELIRIKTPEATHCTKLMQSAHACRGCEHNPHRSRPEVSQKNLALIPRYEPEIRSTLNRIALMDGAGVRWSPDQADARSSKLMVLARTVIREASAKPNA